MTTVNEVPSLVEELRDTVAEKVRTLIANGNNASTYLEQPVRISISDRGAVSDVALRELANKPIVVNENYMLHVRMALLVDRLNRSFVSVFLAPHP
jgi:hypothetical protein